MDLESAWREVEGRGDLHMKATQTVLLDLKNQISKLRQQIIDLKVTIKTGITIE